MMGMAGCCAASDQRSAATAADTPAAVLRNERRLTRLMGGENTRGASDCQHTPDAQVAAC